MVVVMMRLSALLVFAGIVALAQPVRLLRVASGFPLPTEIAVSEPDGRDRLFVVQQRGQIRIIQNGTPLTTPFLDISSRVSCCGERGLLGLAFPPGFATKQYFYVNYTDLAGATIIARYRTNQKAFDTADPASEEVLLRIAQPQANHNGGRMVFGPDGYLYVGTGDGGGSGDPQGNGQKLDTLLGKLLRIDTESGAATYVTPPSNPFAGRAGARPEIWAYGLRNPWKFAFDRNTRDLWIADVGQNRAEEVNFTEAASTGGENYGWNRTEGLQCYPVGSACNRDGIRMPVLEYPRSQGQSITGGYVYRGRGIPSLQGAYVYGDYVNGRIWALRNTGGAWQNQDLLASGLQISTFGQDQDGELYVADYRNGNIFRFVGPPSPIAAVNAASFAPGVTPGSIASVFGTGIAPVVGIAQATAFPLPVDIGGVSVTMNGTRVPVLGVASVAGQDQINIQVPWELAGAASASLVVTVNGQAQPAVTVPVTALQPEIFTVQRQGLAWTVWATGLGDVSNRPGSGQPSPASPLARTTAEAQVTIGGVNAPVFYSGLTPGFAGLYQVNATPPEGVSQDAEVILTVGGVSSKPWRER